MPARWPSSRSTKPPTSWSAWCGFTPNSIYETGEYAILLRSDLKGRGLGWALMQLIIEYARSEGLKMISGDVLQENTIMLEMCRSSASRSRRTRSIIGICDVKLKL